MAQANVQLFSVPSSSPHGVAAYGQAGASALPMGALRLRRGFDFELGLDMEAHLSAEVRQMLVASLSGGVSGKLGLQAQVEFPMDLFGPAGGGFAARMRAQAEAAGYLRLDVGLDLAALAGVLREVTPSPAMQMVEIFLDHVDIRAGVWAHAGVSAQLDAQACMTGTLWPPANAGFTFSCKYAMGFYYGYGVDFISNFVIRDPAALLRRLSDRLSELVLDEAKGYVTALPTGDPRVGPAAAALPYAELLLPAFTRCLFQIGVQLADDSSSAGHREAATAGIVDAFLRESQSLVLRAVGDAVLDRLAEAFPTNVLLQKVAGLSDDNKSRALLDLDALRNVIWSLSAAGLSVHEVLDRVAFCIGPLQDLVELGMFGGSREDLLEAAGLLWTATALATQIARWVEDPANDGGQPASQPAQAPPLPSGAIAAWVAARAGVTHAGTALTVDDLVACLVNSSGLLDPHLEGDLAQALEWLRTVLGMPAGEMLATLFQGERPDADTATQILGRLAEMATKVVNERVMPDLLARVRDAMGQDLGRIFDGVVAPALAAVPAVILPRIADLGGPEKSRRLRETVSALLLQTFNGLVLDSVDILLKRGLEEGARLSQLAANAVREFGEADPAYSVLAATAAGALTGMPILPADAADLLNLSARAMVLWNDNQRDATLAVLRQIMSLHLGTGEGRDEAFGALLGSDLAVFAADLTLALEEVAKGAWILVENLFLDASLIAPRHLFHEGEAILAILDHAAQAGVKVVQEALTVLAQGEKELRKQANAFLKEVSRWAGEILTWIDDLPGKMLDAEAQFLAAVDREAAAVLDVLTLGHPPFVRDAALGLLRAGLAPLRWQLELPLLLLRSTGQLLHQAVTGQIARGFIDAEELRQEVRARILAGYASPIRVPIAVDLGPLGTLDFGTVTVDASALVQIVADLVAAHPAFNATVDAVAERAAAQRTAQLKYVTVDKARADKLTRQQAEEQVVAVLTRDTPVINLLTPVEGSTQDGQIGVRLHVANADASFLKPPLGMPPRLTVHLNGAPCATDPSWWTGWQDGGEPRLDIQLAPTPLQVVSTMPSPYLLPTDDWVQVDPNDPPPLPRFKVWEPPPRVVVGRPGLNTLEVAVAVGDGRTDSAGRTFFLGTPRYSEIMMLSSERATATTYRGAPDGVVHRVRDVPEIAAKGNWTHAYAVGVGGLAQPGVLIDDPWANWSAVLPLQPGTQQTALVVTEPGIRTQYDWIITGAFTGRVRNEVLVYDAVAGTLQRFVVHPDGSLRAAGMPLAGAPTLCNIQTPCPPPAHLNIEPGRDLLALSEGTHVSFLRIDESSLTVLASEVVAATGSWSSSVAGIAIAGTFTASGNPGLFFYQWSGGYWAVFEYRGRPPSFGRAMSGNSPELAEFTDIVPGNFGGIGYTDLFAWNRDTGQAKILASDGATGFTVLNAWNLWQSMQYDEVLTVG